MWKLKMFGVGGLMNKVELWSVIIQSVGDVSSVWCTLHS